jgi:hypothetical protein
MKNVLLSMLMIMILLAACAPQAQPTDLPPVVEEQATQIIENLTPAQQAAVNAVAQNLDLAVDQIRLISSEEVEWPDSCLGITSEETACAQVVTSGFRILLNAAGKQVEYHTNEDGTLILPATEALTWSRSGGIAGFCDSLTIYLSGEIRGTNCNTSQPVVKSVRELLSAEEIATMDEWISRYGVVEIDASDPEGVADQMTVNLKLTGTGTEQLTDPALQQVLVQFVQSLNDKLMNP